MKNLFFLLGFLNILTIYSQTNYIAPEFKGGKKAHDIYVSSYARFPLGSQPPIHELVIATIFIDKSGKIRQVLTKGRKPEFNTEITRVLKLMPDWNPCTLNGEKRDTMVTTPFLFTFLKDGEKDTDHGDTLQIVMYRIAITDFKETPQQAENRKKQEIARGYFKEGMKLSQENKFEEALKKFNLAIESGGKRSEYFYNRGVMYFKLDQKDKACEDMKEAARQNDKDAVLAYDKYCK